VVPYLSTVVLESLFATRRKWAVRALDLGHPPLDAGVTQRLGALLAGLGDTDESVCRAAHIALLTTGEPSVAKLSEALVNSQGRAAWWILRTLAELKANPDEVIPRVSEWTWPGHTALERASAADMLGGYVPARHDCVPALLRLMICDDDLPAQAARRALKPLAAQVRPAMEQYLYDRNPRVRSRAVQALEEWARP
jgi:HEAT repeat protein